MNTTTRRHPRTLGEAFPTGADYACALQRPPPASRALRVASTAAGVLLALALAVHTLLTVIGSILP